MVKIYTRTGDKGETSLFSGQRILKNDSIIDALGCVDECNCAIGTSLSLWSDHMQLVHTRRQLEDIQHALFDVGAALATPHTHSAENKIAKTRFDKEAITLLENWIDGMEEDLPPLHSFILPGGHPCGAMLHMARSLCRRAERAVVPLNKRHDVSDAVMIYLNRLSDYLFVASRYINHYMGCPEILWQPHKMKG